MSTLRWFWLLAMVGCGSDPQNDGSEQQGAGGAAQGCGDNTCAEGENAITCPRDCTAVVDADLKGLSCMEDLEQGELSEQLVLVGAMDDSYHEMVACGALTYLIAEAVYNIFADLIDGKDPAAPSEFAFEEGAWTTGSGGTAMAVTFHYGDDYDVGAEDEVVSHNLFDGDNYLTNIRVEVDYLAFEVIVRYDDTGPLVELLGFGANPARPLRLDLDDVDDLTAGFGRLKLTSTVTVQDERDASVVGYTVATDLKRLNPMLSGEGLAFDVIESQGTHTGPDQQMATTSWEVDYVDDSSVLDGTITFDIDGPTPFNGTFTYDHSSRADIALTCD
jgi:hypothetical protein